MTPAWERVRQNGGMTSVAILGGGPGGYEAALVAAQLGGEVSIIDPRGLGGAAVLTDCVPSKTLVATASVVSFGSGTGALGVRVGGEVPRPGTVGVDIAVVNERILRLAEAQSRDIDDRLAREGIRHVRGRGRLLSAQRVAIDRVDGGDEEIDADIVLLATGARPRTLPDAVPDGERLLTWDQLYSLQHVPEHLIVVGSGVTGAEFASAYHTLGSRITLVSSRERVLPSEDPDAARALEEVFSARGVTVLGRARAKSAARTAEGVVVQLEDGREVHGSHVLLAVGSVPNTEDLGLAAAGVATDERGYIVVDRVSRTSARGVYAAGDCTGVFLLASVAAMQGRIAMWHALGDAVSPLTLSSVSSTVFTIPEIATVGVTQREVDAGEAQAQSVLLPLATNARAKMEEIKDGFVKVFCGPTSRIVTGGVIVAPAASELIHALTLAVDHRLTVDQLASTFTVYPSLSGSVAEAARRLHLASPD